MFCINNISISKPILKNLMQCLPTYSWLLWTKFFFWTILSFSFWYEYFKYISEGKVDAKISVLGWREKVTEGKKILIPIYST